MYYMYYYLLTYYIGGVKTYWQQLQFESDFRDVTLVCDDGHNQAHNLIISSYVSISSYKLEPKLSNMS